MAGTQVWLPAAQPKPSQLKADARSVPSGEPRPQRWHGVCQEGSGVGSGNRTASSPKNKNKLALLRSTDRLSSTPFPNTSPFPAAAPPRTEPKAFPHQICWVCAFYCQGLGQTGLEAGKRDGEPAALSPEPDSGQGTGLLFPLQRGKPLHRLESGCTGEAFHLPKPGSGRRGGLWAQKSFVRLSQTLTLFRARGSAGKDANSVASFCLAPWKQEQKAPMEAVRHLQLGVGTSPEPCS